MLNLNFNFLSKKFDKLPPYYNLKFLITNLKICGSWPPINGRRHVYAVWSVFVLSISLVHLNSVQTVFVLTNFDEREKIASAISLLISNYITAIKVYFHWLSIDDSFIDVLCIRYYRYSLCSVTKNVFKLYWTMHTRENSLVTIRN